MIELKAEDIVVKSEDRRSYDVSSKTQEEDSIIQHALSILELRLRMRRNDDDMRFNNPTDAMNYCRLRFAASEREVFSALWLDNGHRLICCEVLASGTIDTAHVYVREVVKSALARNAAAVIFTHNHPSGSSDVSMADEALTRNLVTALKLIDVRVIDHIVVGEDKAVSMASLGKL